MIGTGFWIFWAGGTGVSSAKTFFSFCQDNWDFLPGHSEMFDLFGTDRPLPQQDPQIFQEVLWICCSIGALFIDIEKLHGVFSRSMLIGS